MSKEVEEATHCISCGNELDCHEEPLCVGHCTQCLEEACEDYWKTEREAFRKEVG